MPIAVQPLSSTAFASLIWELDLNGNASALFGPNPLNPSTPTVEGEQILGRLASVLSLLRTKVIPRVFNSLNTSQITVLHRTLSRVSDDPLGKQFVVVAETIYAVVSGPTTESLQRGLLDVSDYEVLIPAHTLDSPLTEEDAIRIDGLDYDIVGIQGHPKIPSPVAYRYWCKRIA